MIKPKDSAPVPSPVNIQGKVRALEPGERLWVVIQDPLGNWWVQREPVIKGKRWRVQNVCVGEPGDTGREFLIYAAITTEPLACGQKLPGPPSGPSDSHRVIRTEKWESCPPCP